MSSFPSAARGALAAVCLAFAFVPAIAEAADAGKASEPSMKTLIDQLFGTDARTAKAAAKTLDSRGAQTAEDAAAILEALSREASPVKGGCQKSKAYLLAAIQSCRSEPAREVFGEKATPALIAAYPTLPEDERSFGLKVLALLDREDGLAFLVERIKEKDGLKDFFLSVALKAIDPKTLHVGVLFPALTPVLGYPDFRAVAVLDLANHLALAGNLEKHPGAEHLDKLRGFIESKNEDERSYAVSASLALAFVPGPEAEKLLLSAARHPDSRVRLEALYALARRGHSGSDRELARAARDPETSQRAIAYLRELGKVDLVSEDAYDPVFAAKSEMISWLAHPMEFGRAPDTIELWDRRTIYWPPTDDTRELFLFKYSYAPKQAGKSAEVGVGLVGSLTFSLLGDSRPSPDGTPEDALAAHCVWELEQKGDPRGKGRSLEVGRKLLGFEPVGK